MGYGGNLIWTTIFKALNERTGRKVAPVNTPRITDLLSGRKFDASRNLADDPIFRNNPRLVFPPVRTKHAAARAADRLCDWIVAAIGLRRQYELWALRSARRADDGSGPLLVHVDMRIHSYAAHQNRRRTVWKQVPRAADAMLEHLGGGPADSICELYFDSSERARIEEIIDSHRLAGGFVAIEPDTNRDYFGELRAWPVSNWKAAVSQLRREHPGIPIVQVGLKSELPLDDEIVDLRGTTSFREAALLIGRARLFIGTEGGLMHAANAVGARALILWGGITLPEFIGYPEAQTTICKRVACAPCGQLGWCDNNHICMNSISVSEVAAAASDLLQRTK